MAVITYNSVPEFIKSAHFMVSDAITIDSSKFSTAQYAYAQKGMILGKDTETASDTYGKYRPCPVTTVYSAIASGATTIKVSNAKPFAAGDTIAVNTAGSTLTASATGFKVTAVNIAVSAYDTLTIDTGHATALCATNTIYASNGSATPAGILMEDRSFTHGDAQGVLMVHGRVDATRLINYAVLTTALKSACAQLIVEGA